MKIHAVYRSSGGQNRKNRPPYFDKGVSLASFLLAWSQLDDRGELLFLNDGPIPDDRLRLMAGAGTVLGESGLGNAGSYRRAVALAGGRGWDAGDLVYLCEDDYLHLPDAFRRLRDAAESIADAQYFTLYDHPDRYTRSDDADGGRSRVYAVGDRHWRTVESTCMTFAARLAALRRDAGAHRRAARSPIPDDRTLWRSLQGLGLFRLRFARRRLVSPVPSLATHLESEYLAPAVDWAPVAAAARAALEPGRLG